MTNEEKYKLLDAVIGASRDNVMGGKYHKAYECGVINAYNRLVEAINQLVQQPSEDCISRQKTLDCFEQTNTRQGAKYAIETLPPVTPQPKMGRWIYTGDYITDGMLKCSECGFEYDVSERFSYCPNCGVKMEDKE